MAPRRSWTRFEAQSPSNNCPHPSLLLRSSIMLLFSTVALKSTTITAASFMARGSARCLQSRTCISSMASTTLMLEIPTAQDMQQVGALLSIHTGPSDVLLLDGDLGAGKTCLSRGFVRARCGFLEERVTSPTYLLVNTYPTPDGLEIHHMDLYRLKDSSELAPLNLEHVLKNCISLIEWPSRLENMLPEKRLDVTLSIKDAFDRGEEFDEEATTRILKLVPHGTKWEERLDYLVREGYLHDLLIEEVTKS